MPAENIRGSCKLKLIKDDIDYHIEFVVDYITFTYVTMWRKQI